MPAKGKHRRPKFLRLPRAIAVAGTGGAALALPLMGAVCAHAAAPAAAVPSAVQRITTVSTPAGTAAAKTYVVKAGDTLAKIADRQHVSGGWKKLYADNRAVVGADPTVIRPGLKLTIEGQGATQPSASTATRTAAAKTTAAKATPAVDAGYTLPVQGAIIGTGYKVPGSMWSSGYHTGVDFVVPTGTTVRSVAAGTVVSAGWGGAYGNQVVIQHADGRYSQYAHMSALTVAAGQTVTEGQQVGVSGATGNVTGPHLHFEIRTTPDYGSDLDPVAYLRSHGVVVG
ncbi:LysM peptidoglycan-binding domain-containing M23 family metallopeptidase [Streptomyces sp. NBC_01571]|uniref:LysM peptidoglycan-binding domain-containing M23 family metallopeptidase n=1 Tax=Streptomyces sp. NBC_01571 TaxID=2975883 RepID=UPI002256B56B|nr:LysM peptidoglycan-binding domain-containing M23 family metallopeptidase [Streptomyces sp. NBC_01571]MCX4579169.1 LysM peptidoglycan-binding domain-containing M23 family metallopeptidase [Streptomyces sp. NBC_01571]